MTPRAGYMATTLSSASLAAGYASTSGLSPQASPQSANALATQKSLASNRSLKDRNE